ncbi:MAG: DUF4065 domain-containing protein [Yaniella sp.]|uniref:Panacea domain-containing protein n=1 Tax=Yaniella sp. TaxID=2773929 RepID=UPI0026476E8F|nr:type II toxin-antitoxin system antitoxin SocA domain-containing protein [Yaniella sp.]MDN5704923.1 DUF4065 domain-containing protein [Yaniella sp.]MDN5731044.1 DUF4065 domain-containing protein [Yaniella sp.]MDN5742405.1 DUF4065 domain-containing protein [Yaniella sp.]MDN5815057.1 DUF4065 domain-containing protein [Yaniella sp.]MDN5817691.1 DUF4065 domain-containing protein [Yaniella sp.]
MANAIEVLAYIKKSFPTSGRMRRQKILYYAQAWHLAWQGAPLFEEDIEAWEMEPVVPTAWRADKEWNADLVAEHTGGLTTVQSQIVDAVWAFYGESDGTALSARTHKEDPWVRHSEDVNSFLRGNDIIPKEEMRSYYSVKSLSDFSTPQKPALQAQGVSDDELFEALEQELPRWGRNTPTAC